MSEEKNTSRPPFQIRRVIPGATRKGERTDPPDPEEVPGSWHAEAQKAVDPLPPPPKDE